MQNIWNQNAGRQLDIKQAVANQENRYNNFLTENAEKEVFDAAPREFFNNLVPQSSFNPNIGMSKGTAQRLMRQRALKSGHEIVNDKDLSLLQEHEGVNHFVASGRRPYIRTINRTLEYPDMSYVQMNNGKHRKYYVKKYIDKNKGEDFFDLAVIEDGKLFNKFNTNENYLINQFNKPTKDLSLGGEYILRPEPTGGSLDAYYTNSIYRNGAIVNPKILNISTIERGLTDFQKKVFYETMAQAVESSSEKVGSLGTTHIIQDTLGDMLKKSYKVSETGKKLPTAESLQLYELKTKLNELMKPSGIDKYEASLAKADALRSAYRQGYGFVLPGSTAGGLSFKSLRERQAFLQGRLANHLRKAKDGHDLAAKIAADKETFRSLMPQRNYDNLMREIAKINAGAGDNLYNWVPYLVQILGE